MIARIGGAHLARRPKSTLAQWLTATLAAAALVVLVVATVVTWGYLDRVVHWYDARNPVGPPTLATFQEHCLEYSSYVLDQHRAGLSVEQIQATLDRAARAGEQYAARGRHLDDTLACGAPAEILEVAGQN